MTELKTLKDFDRIQDSLGNAVVDKGVLKQEAIKWVKEIIAKEIGKSVYIKGFDAGQCEWIKHFFNITEEDLK